MRKRIVIEALLLSGLLWAAGEKDGETKRTSWPHVIEVPIESSASDEEAQEGERLEKREAPLQAAAGLLVEASIIHNALRVYSSRPAVISLYSATGQLLYHGESKRPIQLIPLQGINAGFLYLSVRDGNLEAVRKLVYTGK